MKTIIIWACFLAWLGCAPGVHAEDFKEKMVRELSLSKEASTSTLAVFNINGFIRVEGYSGNKVLIEVEKTITAGDKETLEAGKRDLKLLFEQNADSIIVYTDDPICSFHRRNGGRNRENGRCGDCCGHNRQRADYDFKLNFTIKVPFAMNLYVSTVNKGDVVVKGVEGNLRTFNVNGAITLTDVKGTTEVSTVNGDVEAHYKANPDGKSSYHTLNGDIKIDYPANLSADLQFKNTNGDFYTDFPNAELLPVEVTKNQEGRGGGTVYKLNKASSVRIGNGGRTYRYETFNGNIYIKKSK
jgi:hypothetical protein